MFARFGGILAATILTFGCSQQSAHLGGPVVRNRGDSLVSVLANPEKYYDHRVSVVGFAHFEFEGNGLFLHREDYEHGIRTNSVWLDRTGLDPALVAAANDRYALVIGRYIDRNGHMGCCIGSITQIEVLEPWPLER